MDVTRILRGRPPAGRGLVRPDRSTKGADRQPLVDELATALRAHMELEETVLYPAMGPVTGKEAVQEANTEHELARKSLEDVVRLAPTTPGFGAALDATRAGIVHHVDEEENEVFTELRKDGRSVLDQIATPFMQKRVEARLAHGRLRPRSSVHERRAGRRSEGGRRGRSGIDDQGRTGQGAGRQDELTYVVSCFGPDGAGLRLPSEASSGAKQPPRSPVQRALGGCSSALQPGWGSVGAMCGNGARPSGAVAPGPPKTARRGDAPPATAGTRGTCRGSCGAGWKGDGLFSSTDVLRSVSSPSEPESSQTTRLHAQHHGR